jgi:hypothetical protein
MTTDRRPAVRKLLWTKCLRGETGEKINGDKLPETELYNVSGKTDFIDTIMVWTKGMPASYFSQVYCYAGKSKSDNRWSSFD